MRSMTRCPVSGGALADYLVVLAQRTSPTPPISYLKKQKTHALSGMEVALTRRRLVRAPFLFSRINAKSLLPFGLKAFCYFRKRNGGGAGNRTRVLGSLAISFYMRSLSFGLTLIPPLDRILRASL